MAKEKELEVKSQEISSNASGDQNKLTGLNIAAGRIWYQEYGEGKYGYLFKKNHGFSWQIDDAQMAKYGLTMGALMDCIEQLEKMGDPTEVRKAAEFRDYQGPLNNGLVITSGVDPRVKMTVTFDSSDQEEVDFWVGWYLDNENLDHEMKVNNPKYQPEREASPEELKVTDRAREDAPVVNQTKMEDFDPEKELLGLSESFVSPMVEKVKSNKTSYLVEESSPVEPFPDYETKILAEGTEKESIKGDLMSDNKPISEDLAEVDFWGLPGLAVTEDEGTPMKAGSGLAKPSSKTGTQYGEAPGKKPEHSKGVKEYDKETDKIATDLPEKKDKAPLPVKAGSAIEKPHSEEGENYDEKDADKKNQLGDPKDGVGDHMQGKGSSDDQQTDVPKAKVKPGDVDSKPKLVGEAADGGEEPPAPMPDEEPKKKNDLDMEAYMSGYTEAMHYMQKGMKEKKSMREVLDTMAQNEHKKAVDGKGHSYMEGYMEAMESMKKRWEACGAMDDSPKSDKEKEEPKKDAKPLETSKAKKDDEKEEEPDEDEKKAMESSQKKMESSGHRLELPEWAKAKRNRR